MVADDTIHNNNKFEELLLTSYLLKTIKIVVVIINISYFLGIIWIVLCQLSENLGDTFSVDHFNDKFEVNKLYESWDSDRANWRMCLMGMYFSFTSLSTVGFGDYHPRSNLERLVTSLILLLGVSVFSYILGNFVEIMGTLQELNKDLDEGDELTKFFQVIKRFNGNKNINKRLTDKI